MKKLFYSASIGSIMLLLAVLVQSCKQDVAVQPTPTVDNATTPVGTVSSVKLTNVEVIDGRLAFKSEADWRTAIDQIYKNQNSLDGLEAQFKGFTSQKQAQDNFTEADLIRTNGDLTPFEDFMVKNVRGGETFYDGVVQSKLLAQLVNAEGLVQAGDKVYKFAPGILYEFNVNDMASYRANKNNLSAITNVQKINLNESKQRIQATSRDAYYVDGQKTDVYQLDGNGYFYRRFDAYLTSQGPAFLVPSLAEVRLEHRKRGAFGSWYDERTEMSFSGSVKVGVMNTITGTTENTAPAQAVNVFGNNHATISAVVGKKIYTNFKYIYFAPTNVNYSGIQQPGNLPYKYTNLNITFN
jgi:hypothetical protein